MAERGLLQRFEQAGPLTWLLAACAGWALVLWLAALLGLGNAVAPTEKIAADAALPQAKPASPDRIGPLAQYAEAAARPVFTSDRRPRNFMATGPEGGAAAGAQSQSLDFILTGVLISPQVRMAFLQPTGGGESVRVREGASPEGAPGWRLVDVQPRRAVFAGNGTESSLDLRVFGESHCRCCRRCYPGCCRRCAGTDQRSRANRNHPQTHRSTPCADAGQHTGQPCADYVERATHAMKLEFPE